MDMSKFKDGRIHFGNLGMNGLLTIVINYVYKRVDWQVSSTTSLTALKPDKLSNITSCRTQPAELVKCMTFSGDITKTYLYNFDPLKPHFCIVKLGFTGVYIIFLISAQNIDCGYSLEPPHRGGSNEYPQSMFCAEIWKISEFFISNFSFFFFFWW